MTKKVSGFNQEQKRKKEIDFIINARINTDGLLKRALESHMFTGRIDESIVKRFFNEVSNMLYYEDLPLIKEVLNTNPMTRILAQKLEIYKSFFKPKQQQPKDKGREGEIKQELKVVKKEGNVEKDKAVVGEKPNPERKEKTNIDEIFKEMQKIRHKIRNATSYSEFEMLIKEYDENLEMLKELFIKQKTEKTQEIAFYKDQGIKFLLELNHMMGRIKTEKDEWLRNAFLYMFDYFYMDQFFLAVIGDKSCLDLSINIDGNKKTVYDLFLPVLLYYVKLNILNRNDINHVEDVLRKFNITLDKTDKDKHNKYLAVIKKFITLLKEEHIHDNEVREKIDKLRGVIEKLI